MIISGIGQVTRFLRYFWTTNIGADAMKKLLIYLTLSAAILAVPVGADSVTVSADSITISWDDVMDSRVNNYRLYRGRAPGKYDTSVNTGKHTTYTMCQLHERTIYYFAVRAESLVPSESSALSNEVSRKPVLTVTPCSKPSS